MTTPLDSYIGGKCCRPNCPMTLVRYIGAGLWLCWLHAVALGVEAPRS